MSLFLLLNKSMLVTKQLLDPIDFYCIFSTYGSMGSNKCLVTNILFLFNKRNTGLEEIEGE